MVPNPLQHGENFDHRSPPFVERLAQYSFLLVKGFQPRLGCVDAGFEVAYAGRRINKLLIKRATVRGKALHFMPELGLALGRLPFFLPRRVEFLIALFNRVGIDFGPVARCGRGWRRGQLGANGRRTCGAGGRFT